MSWIKHFRLNLVNLKLSIAINIPNFKVYLKMGVEIKLPANVGQKSEP